MRSALSGFSGSPSIIWDISFVAFASQRSVVSLQGGSLKAPAIVCEEKYGDSGSAPKFLKSESGRIQSRAKGWEEV